MVVCLRRAAQHQANRQAGGIVITDFIRILLVGRGKGMKLFTADKEKFQVRNIFFLLQFLMNALAAIHSLYE